jgi:acetyl esterase/lipase
MSKKRFVSFILVVMLVFNTGVLFSQSAGFTRAEDVIFGRKDGMALTMDVFSPEQPRGIGVILLISGGWVSSHGMIDAQWKANIETLVKRGITVFAVVHSSMPEYKIPDIQKDVARAVRYIRYNANQWNVDPTRLGITGQSSGGHLSLLHAEAAAPADTSSKDPVDQVSSAVGAVACFYPPTDFLFFGSNGINVLASPRFQKFLAAFVDDPSDSLKLAKAAEAVSPVKYISALMVPTLIIAGSADKLVPIEQSRIYIEKLKEFNIPCKLEIREGKDHGWPDIAQDYNVIADWFELYLPANHN